MPQYLIVCRSLTYAQRAQKLLEHAGITATVVRAPAEATGTGCGYCVKVPENKLADALKTLKRNDYSPIKILMKRDGNVFEEVRQLET